VKKNAGNYYYSVIHSPVQSGTLDGHCCC